MKFKLLTLLTFCCFPLDFASSQDFQSITQAKVQDHIQALIQAKRVARAATQNAPVLKPWPSGIYFLPAGAQPGQVPDYTNNPWTAPYASGFALRSDWSLIEPSDGSFDWSLFDSGIASASAARKKVSLSLAAGGFSPPWLAAGAQTVTLNVITSFAGVQTSTFVVPWDPTFQAAWQSTVQAFGDRYDANPTVSYVYIGGAGDYIETFIVQNQADYEAFNAAGGLAAWTLAVENIIDMYAVAFPTTPFVLALGNPINIPGDAVDQALGLSALQQVVSYGFASYPGRFGVVDQGLSQDSASLTAPTGASYKTDLLTQNENIGPCGFQMTATMGTNLGPALNAGEALDPHSFIEVYKADCMDPNNADLLQSANAKLISTESSATSTP